MEKGGEWKGKMEVDWISLVRESVLRGKLSHTLHKIKLSFIETLISCQLSSE